jgi:cholesterol transport system auxiliary component
MGAMMRAARHIVGLFLAVALSGCSLAVSSSPPQTYDLVAPEVKSVRGAPLPVQLVVHTPSAVRALDTERILVRPKTDKITYYPRAAWSDRLPALFRARLTEALEDSGHFKAVVSAEDRVSSRYSLQIALRAFEMSVNGKPLEGHVAISAKIVDERAGKVIATRRFEARSRAKSDSVGNAVAAITDAFHDVSRELIAWMTKGSRRSRLGAES